MENFKQQAAEKVAQVTEKARDLMNRQPVEFEFEKQIPVDKREKDCAHILQRYPDRVPVICEKAPNARGIPQIISKKFLVPKQMTVSQLIVVVKNQLGSENHSGWSPNETKTLYFTRRNGQPVMGGTVLEKAHQEHASPDGFLYMHYSEETVFGQQ